MCRLQEILNLRIAVELQLQLSIGRILIIIGELRVRASVALIIMHPVLFS